MGKRKKAAATPQADSYKHSDATSPMRPDVGTQAQFRKKRPPATYRYDSSLSPALDWDDRNPARDEGERLIREILQAKSLEEAKAAAARLKTIERPFLNWAGKAERLSFDVPTLPLFVHERLSTQAILQTLTGHRKSEETQLSLFGDPQHSIADQVLKAYEHRDNWVNRLILGDSLVVMNSLLHYESLGGQVQMIYMDPPYGVKFGSNFQPFVRKRDVKHGDDDDMTREPEMVQAYRDTWELGLHSYLTYMRDRLLLCRELLAPGGSIFVQISDENLHHVCELLDEVFGAENAVGVVNIVKTSGLSAAENLATATDYLIWYAKDRRAIKYRQLFINKESRGEGLAPYSMVELPDGSRRALTKAERDGDEPIPSGARRYRIDNLTKPGPGSKFDFEFGGKTFTPGKRWWGTTPEGMAELANANRLAIVGTGLWYLRFWDDVPFSPLNNLWTDTSSSFMADKLYVVQTTPKVIERCVLMTTDPGDLVLDPTCGSGTTPYVSEQWGRRWITIDTSRVPLALARQRLLTATFPWYELKDAERGPAGGFVYKRKQNKKGEEVGGIVPHVTLKSIANNEPPQEEVLVDRPEVQSAITRVTGAFCVEGTIPTPVDWEGDGQEGSGKNIADEHLSFVDRMLEILRRSPVLQVGGGKTVTLKQVRPPAKSLCLSAEALVEGFSEKKKLTLQEAAQEAAEQSKQALPLSTRPVALVFGPENGAVSESLVFQAAREAHAKSYTHLYVIGFMIQANARELVDKCEAVMDIGATYIQATPDLLMGDLLKNMRSSQIFSVCGLPDVKLHKKNGQFRVELLGLDVFDPITMEPAHRGGNDVPAWLLDTDYNGLCFHVSQAFFPRTSAWENLRKALKATHEETVWDHLSGTTSAPFERGEHSKVAVKVIDDRGNELLVVKELAGVTAGKGKA